MVGTHRAVPGHREQLLAALNQPPAGAKPAAPGLTLTHMEGGQWQFLTVNRYNSWQELGADRTATTASADGWGEIRQHSASHNDTIADRVK